MSDLRERLGFHIEARAGVDVLVYKTGCRPASDVEAQLWNELEAAAARIQELERELAAFEPADDIVAAAKREAFEAAADCVPTNWLDPLLTGPEAAFRRKDGKFDCREIEALLRGIQDRIRARLAGKGEG